MEGPRAVVIKQMPVAVPAVPCVIGENGGRVIPHHPMIHRVSLPVQKGQNQHIKQAPVVVARIGMAKIRQVICNAVPLLLRIILPDHLPAHGQADNKRSALTRVLKRHLPFLRLRKYLLHPKQIIGRPGCDGEQDLF